jgi:hypothetical protein
VARSVLVYAAMSRLAAAAVTVAAMTSVASAGTYVGLGIGTSPDGNMGQYETVEGAGRSGRLMLGTRFGKLAVEGQGSRFNMLFSGSEFETTQLGVGLKLNIPLGNNFEIFGRGGVQRTWLNFMGTEDRFDAAGNGWLGGLGVEYRLSLGVTSASIFMDYQRSSTTVENGQMAELDSVAGMWTLGATFSL